MEWLILVILIGLIPAAIAKGKGRSFVAWWFYGMALFIVALPHALIMRSSVEGVERRQAASGLRKCPFCAEMIKPDARVCRYCGRDLMPSGGGGLCGDCGTAIPPGRVACPKCGALQAS